VTITTLPARNEFTSNAGQTIFNYTFKIFSITDLNVYITPTGQTANDSTDLTTAYTVLGVGDEDGGTITLTVGANINDLVTIVSNTPSSRTTDYQNNGDFRPTVVNDDFDRVVSLVKKIEDVSNRSVLLEQSQQDPKPLSLPAPVAQQLVRWKGDLTGFENVTVEQLGVVAIQDLTKTVDNVSVAVATNFTPGQFVRTGGYYAGWAVFQNQKGDGLYLVKSASQASSDGDVIDEWVNHTMTNGNILILQIEDNLKSFQAGLKGDDTQESFAAWDAFLAAAKVAQAGAHVVGGTYNFGYASPLEFVGNSLLVFGDGARSNAEPQLGTFIKAKVTFGTTTVSFFFSRVRDMMIAGPGFDIFPSTASHDHIGIEMIKSVETKLNNITIEGFKYGISPHDDATITILANWNMSIVECRLYNNSICELEWGRGGHGLHVENCDIQIGQHLVVLGVFNHTTDAIIQDNAEPVDNVVFDGANTFQSNTGTAIVIMNSKGVTIRDCYFEAGPTVDSFNQYIILGSATAAAVVFNGFEDTCMAPTIESNVFITQTNVLTYPAGFECITFNNVNGGSVSNNRLVNVANVTTTAEEQGLYLVGNKDKTKFNRTRIENNIAVNGKDQYRDFFVLDQGFSTFHNSNLYQYDLSEQKKPNTLRTVAEAVQQTGRDLTISLLGGADEDDPSAQWGAAQADFPKLAKVGPFSAIPTTGDFRMNSKLVIGRDTGWHAVVGGTFGTLTGVTGTGTSGTAELTVNILDTLAVGNIINIVGSSLAYEVIGIETLLVHLDRNLDFSPSGAAVSYQLPTLAGYGVVRL